MDKQEIEKAISILKKQKHDEKRRAYDKARLQRKKELKNNVQEK
jgi:hypothetical protein